jgi:hypothetical protein
MVRLASFVEHLGKSPLAGGTSAPRDGQFAVYLFLIQENEHHENLESCSCIEMRLTGLFKNIVKTGRMIIFLKMSSLIIALS